MTNLKIPTRLSIKTKRDQTREEEVINSVSHGIGLLAAIAGTPILVTHAIQHGEAGYIVGTAIFTLTVILLYLASTIYHVLPPTPLKNIFGVIDHPGG